jgi:hypothetical protein
MFKDNITEASYSAKKKVPVHKAGYVPSTPFRKGGYAFRLHARKPINSNKKPYLILYNKTHQLIKHITHQNGKYMAMQKTMTAAEPYTAIKPSSRTSP